MSDPPGPRRDWDRFIRERRTGRIGPAGKATQSKVGSRTVARDLLWLRAVLNWATLAGDGEGGYLLDRNPLQGFPLPSEKSPRRPRLTHERYEAMQTVAGAVDWRFELALVLAHETGHRIGAIRRLRWSDVDLHGRTVLWRREADKMGREHRTPLTEAAAEALRRAQKHALTIGETWLLPDPSAP